MRRFVAPAILAALCITPAADACFLKWCCGKKQEASLVKVDEVKIVTVGGQIPGAGGQIPLPVDAASHLNIVTYTNFMPSMQNHDLSECTFVGSSTTASIAIAEASIQKTTVVGPDGRLQIRYQFPYTINENQILPGKCYKLRMKVNNTYSDYVYFTTQ
jgi:hypothetical protein